MKEKWTGERPIQYWDNRHGFWRYGKCVEEGWKWATVLAVNGKRVRLEVGALREVPNA